MVTIADLGEFALIAAIAKRLAAAGDVLVGAGDDAAVLRAPDRRVVATTDMLIEGRHFRLDWSPATDIGRKAAARNLADVAAMGARPTGVLLALAAPGATPVGWVLDLVDGVAEECAAAGAGVAGGDTSGASTIMLAITALGDLGGAAPVTRSGARPGDVIAIAGTLGRAAAGLALLRAGASSRRTPGDTERDEQPGDSGVAVPAGTLDGLIGAHRRPRPPYDAGPQAARLGATSMIDVSDGLMADLGHIAEASGVRLDVRSADLLAEPVAQVTALRAAAIAVGEPDWRGWVLAGGDDHALAATFPAGTALPERWTVVGEVAHGAAVTVDGREWTGQAGWEHFRE